MQSVASANPVSLDFNRQPGGGLLRGEGAGGDLQAGVQQCRVQEVAVGRHALGQLHFAPRLAVAPHELAQSLEGGAVVQAQLPALSIMVGHRPGRSGCLAGRHVAQRDVGQR